MRKFRLVLLAVVLIVTMISSLVVLYTRSGHLGIPDDPPKGVPPPSPSDVIVDPGHFETRVFFATDRNKKLDSPAQFGGKRGSGKLTYGHVMVSIPKSHRKGHIESPAWWQIWNRDDPSKFVLVLSVEEFAGQSEFTLNVKTRFEIAGRSDVLLFIHGYNVGFEGAAQRTAQLAYDLEFIGAPMFYSWPAAGELKDYLADETSIEWTIPHFRTFLKAVLTEISARDVHVIAHSMGNRALIKALSTIDVASLPAGSARLRQIILAAPDIDADIFRQLAANFPGKAERITLYTSRNDKAIIASKKLHGYARAGGTVVVVDGVDTIDASAAKTNFLAHSYFGESILSDIFYLVKKNLPPSDRFGLVEKTLSEGAYWEFAPGAAR